MTKPSMWRFNLACCASLTLFVWGLSLIATLWLDRSAGQGGSDRIWILDVDSEESIFTWMSVLALAAAAAVLVALAQHQGTSRRDRSVWFALALLFAILSFDEFYGLHERLGDLVRLLMGESSGVPHFYWAIPAGLLSLAGLAMILPFLRSLGRRTATLMLASASIYLSGAVGSELLGGLLAFADAMESLTYRVLVNIEEALEMGRLLLFIFALLDFRERCPAPLASQSV